MELSRPGFSVYLTLGFPEPAQFSRILERFSSCVDFYELGLPTARPKYDGPTVRASHRRVVSAGLRGLKALKLLEKTNVDKPFTLMAYMEDYVDNLRELLEAAASAGAGCVLLPDLAFDYPEMLDTYVEESERAGLRPCFFASSRFPHNWLQRYAALNPLYIYLGLQPATGVELPIAVEKNVRLARMLIGDRYLLTGFAIHRPETAAALIRSGADAVVVGSAIIRLLEEKDIDEAKSLACGIYQAVHSVKHSQEER
ncbi:tryptophan synthase alpha chain [Pyrodictium delaneyi]|uniref:tryptophan synthase n=1 Tax=Pyrodictium delaneyi TaxID=1273541 RepID=A0A0P0N380_9CREN|nr:tryptophan synthase subunit alpha [Pyrodictium delaneyi]ALL00987.1 tryptophan synthase alpha chain [Pyrodictium delaneyi]OWJ55408.1 tryptophan synthase subunit alpha [Pyrodictium delaneyi]